MSPDEFIQANRERTLCLVDPENGRVVYVPQDWCDELIQDDDEDGPCVCCWYGNPDCLAFRDRDSHEYLTTDAQAYFPLQDLADMREVGEEEARILDPDLFTLLDSVNSGEAI